MRYREGCADHRVQEVYICEWYRVGCADLRVPGDTSGVVLLDVVLQLRQCSYPRLGPVHVLLVPVNKVVL